MATRIHWTCPGCAAKYAVPSTTGLTVCPKCASRLADLGRKTRFRQRLILGCVAVAFSTLGIAYIANVINRSESDNAKADVVPDVRPVEPEKVAPMQEAIVRAPEQNPNPKPQVAPDTDLALVREYLKSNTRDGKWQEVYWWSGVTLQKLFDARLTYARSEMELAQKEFDEIETKVGTLEERGVRVIAFSPTKRPPAGQTADEKLLWNLYSQSYHAKKKLDGRTEFYQNLNRRGVRRICGMKLRTKNEIGATDLYEILFDVTDSNLSVVDGRTYEAFVDGTDNGWEYLKNPSAKVRPGPSNDFSNTLKGIVDSLEKGKTRPAPKPVKQ